METGNFIRFFSFSGDLLKKSLSSDFSYASHIVSIKSMKDLYLLGLSLEL